MNAPNLEVTIKTSQSGHARTLVLNKRVLSIGAQLSNDIVISNRGVEDTHCELEIQDDPSCILFRQKDGSVFVSGEDTSLQTGEAIEYDTALLIASNEISINRLDSPELPPANPELESEPDPENEDDFNEEDYEVIGDASPSESFTQSETEQAEDIFPDGETKPTEEHSDTVDRQQSSSKLPIMFFGIVLLGLFFGGGGFYYVQNSNTVESMETSMGGGGMQQPAVSSTDAMMARLASLRPQIEAILIENDIEVETIQLTNRGYHIAGYAKTNTAINVAEERIRALLNNRINLKVYSDEQLRQSVDMILTTREGEYAISNLSYGRLRLKGTVSSNTEIDAVRDLLQQDIPALRSINMADMSIAGDMNGEEPMLETEIIGVWLGNPPFLKMANGKRYTEGDLLTDGRVVLSISEDEIVLMNNTEMEIIPMMSLQ